MTTEKLSALISLVAAATIVGATFFQWWDVTFDGDLRLRMWVRALLVLVLIALGIATVPLFV